MNKNRLAQPFLKWAGGKRQILPEIRKYIPNKFSSYYEPFIGAGALVFDLQPKKAIVNDINSELINVYKVIKSNVNGLIKALKRHKNDADYYYEIRELDRSKNFEELSDVEKAARIIYLNKTCYNGLFRVNSQGQFNVPFGRYNNPEIVNEIVLKAVSNFLNASDIKFINTDFEESVQDAKKDSFIYFDPPYYPLSDTSAFTGYTLDGFDKEEQERLKLPCDKLDKKGCKFLLSNSAAPFILDLYKNYNIETVQVNRNINSIGSKRGKIAELLVRNYD